MGEIANAGGVGLSQELICTRFFQSRHFRCVCPPCVAQIRPENPSQEVSYVLSYVLPGIQYGYFVYPYSCCGLFEPRVGCPFARVR